MSSIPLEKRPREKKMKESLGAFSTTSRTLSEGRTTMSARVGLTPQFKLFFWTSPGSSKVGQSVVGVLGGVGPGAGFGCGLLVLAGVGVGLLLGSSQVRCIRNPMPHPSVRALHSL